MTPQLQSIVDSSRAAEKDILVTLNYVQLLAVLVGSKHTLQFIKGSGVIEDMKKLLQDTTHRNAVFLEPSNLPLPTPLNSLLKHPTESESLKLSAHFQAYVNFSGDSERIIRKP